MSDQGDAAQLVRRIRARRRMVDDYLRSARPRADRLTWVSIVSSALAAALTAGPAVGGGRFTGEVSEALELAGGPAAVWRPLCVLAMVVSIVAAISANLAKARNAESRIISAEACNAELEGLLTLVEFRQLPLDEAVKLYQQYVTRIPFVPDAARGSRRGRGRNR